MRHLFLFTAFTALACADSSPPGLTGTIRDVNGPVSGAIVRLQHFPTAACRDLSATTTLTPAQSEEFARCTSNIGPATTDGSGAYRLPGLAPGWYSMTVRWTIDQKPAVAEPNTIVDGFLIIYMETRSMPPRYILSALDTAAFEVKAGDQVVRNFTFRPQGG